MRKSIKAILTVGTAVTFSTAALAWGYDVSQSREIYRDTIAVRTRDGKLGHATLVFAVTAVTYVGEDGNAHWPDNRACYYNNVRRTLVRSLAYTAPDGTDIPVRDTIEALPDLPGRHWDAVTTCNDVITQINSDLVSAAGSATTWQSYIDGDKAKADQILSQFGVIQSRLPETKPAMF